MVKNKVRLEVVEDVCVDQIFKLKQMCNKMKEMKTKLYLDFMHWQQAYDRIKREALWQVLMIYGINGRLLNGIKSVYVDNEARVRINEVNGLRVIAG